LEKTPQPLSALRIACLCKWEDYEVIIRMVDLACRMRC